MAYELIGDRKNTRINPVYVYDNKNSGGGGDDDFGDEGNCIIKNKTLIWHITWLALTFISLVVLIAYLCNGKEFIEKYFTWIKRLAVPILLIPSIAETIILIMDKGDDKNKDDDGEYVRPDLFSGWPFILMNLAAVIYTLEMSLIICSVKKKDQDDNFRYKGTYFLIFVAFENLLRCAYSDIMRRRMRK